MSERQARRQRIDRLIGELAAAGLDGIAVTRLVNVRYLTGFTGSNGAASIASDGAVVLVTDGRYVDQAAAETDGIDITINRNLFSALADAMTGRWAVETHDLSVDGYAEFEEICAAELVSAKGLVEVLRQEKDEVELAALRQACEISTAALSWLVERPLTGSSERQIARVLENRMLELGAEAIGFSTIVAAGDHSAIPHHQPTDRPLAPNELLKIDFGARTAGYHADCTRTFVSGVPADWQREIHDVVRAAQRAAVATCVSGTALGDVDAAARSYLDESGWGQYFTTGLGHGVGLVIHEDPFISSSPTAKLTARTVLTVEPGIYLPGRGGVRIEDTVEVGSDSNENQPQLLTAMTTDLLEIA